MRNHFIIRKCPKGCCKLYIRTDYTPCDDDVYTKFGKKKAGICIHDPHLNSVLLVQSRGNLWGLPKGTVEDETLEECAVRETMEETGLEILPEEFLTSVRVNRATYYYVKKEIDKTDFCKIVETVTNNNDSTGITYIKMDCLKQMVENNSLPMNRQAKIVLQKLLNVSLENISKNIKNNENEYTRWNNLWNNL